MRVKCPVKHCKGCYFKETECYGTFYERNGEIIGCDRVVKASQISSWYVEQVKDYAISEISSEGLKYYANTRRKY